MGVQRHLLDGEEIEATFSGSEWIWMATDQRLIKFKDGTGGEQLSDLSYDQISGIDLTNAGRSRKWLYLAGGSMVLGLGILALGQPLGGVIGAMCMVFLWLWDRSKASYFEFRGRLAGDRTEKWRIDRTSLDDEDEATDFVKAVREKIAA